MPTRRAAKRTVEHGTRAATMATAMPIATMTTLAHRLPMLFGALSDARAWTDPEFQRMLTEKMQTGQQVSTAMTDMIVATQSVFIRYGLEQAGANLALATGSAPDPSKLFSFAATSGSRLTGLMAALGEIVGKSAVGSLDPAHKKVTANAKRLTRRAGLKKR